MDSVKLWGRCSFMDWLDHCSLMDSWNKDLQTMRYCDWAIHRKLGAAAGFTHRYVIPARGSGKSMFYRESSESELDKDIFGAGCDPVRRKRSKKIEAVLGTFYGEQHQNDIYKKLWISTVNPYRQIPNGYFLDPTWSIGSDGTLRLTEVSIMPRYTLDECWDYFLPDKTYDAEFYRKQLEELFE